MEEKNLVEQVKELHETFVEANKPKEKKPKIKSIRLPRKAKVKGRRIKKGWIGILRIDENGNMVGERQKVEGSAYKLSSGTYHAMDGNQNKENGQEILFWKGKYPFIIQETKKKNPKKFNGGKNETYGQKYIQTMMLNDQIKSKGKMGASWVLWLVGAVVIFFVVKTIIDKGGI